jgi:ferredoxin
MRVEVDLDKCTGHGICESIADDVFEVQDDGTVLMQQAVTQCPAAAVAHGRPAPGTSTVAYPQRLIGTELSRLDAVTAQCRRFSRLHLPVGRTHRIYGGTLEVFRNMIAQHALGLGRPNYAPAKQKSSA